MYPPAHTAIINQSHSPEGTGTYAVLKQIYEMPEDSLCVLVVGAHPDDADIKAGGLAAKYAAAGHNVRFVSMTNGSAGHHELSSDELIQRRRSEAQSAADAVDIEYDVLEKPDGRLQPTLENRDQLIRLVREYDPDLVLTHRPNDYHPDHRYTSELVQDSAYMVTVPNVCPDTPHLREDPVIAYLSDSFRKPIPFEPDVVVSIDDVIDEKMEMLHQHESQMYEWLPYNKQQSDEVPDDDRCAWLREQWCPSFADTANRFRSALVDRYGEEEGASVQYAEAFEGCEYGAPLTGENVDRLFPF